MSAPALVRFALAGALALLAPAAEAAPTVSFAGYTWMVRTYGGGPGPNNWDAGNVFVDAAGLHLKISQVDGVWSCAEVVMTEALGFGSYQFEVTGRPDKFDPNIVLGLFNYPPSPEVGPDGTNEIDIEFAQWGQPGNANRLNWTVYPPAPDPKATHRDLPFALSGDVSTHSFEWTAKGVAYQSFDGTTEGRSIGKWNDAPKSPLKHIPQQPLPVHINLWLSEGHPPTDGQPVEIVISDFRFTPLSGG